MQNQKFIVILMLISIFSGCVESPIDANTVKTSIEGELNELIYSENGSINKTVFIKNLTINAMDYTIYKIKNSNKKVLQINFIVANKGKNELEYFPDKIVLVLSDGTQITQIDDTIQNSLFKGIKRKIGIDIKSGEEIFPGATRDFSAVFWISNEFDIESTKIEVLYRGIVETF